MKISLSPALTLFKNRYFPATFNHKIKNFQVTLGIGGNEGDSRRIFHKLLIHLKKSKCVKLIQSGPILKNPPFGFKEQNDFYNTVIILETKLLPKEFLRYILRVEKKFKRKRSFKNAPRTLDLDIIFFSKYVIDSKDLTIPHPLWSERESVVIPLRYMYGIKNF